MERENEQPISKTWMYSFFFILVIVIVIVIAIAVYLSYNREYLYPGIFQILSLPPTPDSTKFMYLTQGSSTGSISATGTNAIVALSNSGNIGLQEWYFIPVSGGFYIQNVMSKNYLNQDTTTVSGTYTGVTLSTLPSIFNGMVVGTNSLVGLSLNLLTNSMIVYPTITSGFRAASTFVSGVSVVFDSSSTSTITNNRLWVLVPVNGT